MPAEADGVAADNVDVEAAAEEAGAGVAAGVADDPEAGVSAEAAAGRRMPARGAGRPPLLGGCDMVWVAVT